ncbi:HAD-IIA family hydrolase [Roseibium aggregatum]|uniref:HAD hydrolase-like protein n=1 Tax=Roseibium aggregatum TaxID=187304 RepID=A0A926S7D3_9HYPH|nr:HAD family hydrolase [Roseibium aggregatum]MBD1548526.1 HAD hydrolase-like protein [Roseibium aggregatum]
MLELRNRQVAELTPEMVAGYDAVLCDLDGCLVAGGQPLSGALEFAHSVANRLWIVSNNSADTGETLSDRLAVIGFNIPAERICLAGEVAVNRIAREYPGATVQVFAEDPICDLAQSLGLRPVEHGPEVVLLARDPKFAIADLQRLLKALHQGADLIVANLDATHPDPDGLPVPETGALAAAVRLCKPDVVLRSFGKPEPALIDLALDRSGATAETSVFVGDNPATDGEAAARAGLAFIHVARPPAAALHKDPVSPRQGALSC